METLAIVMEEPRALGLRVLALADPAPSAVVAQVKYTSISAGTERRLWQGSMPAFPGMGYPLVPGYETVGTVVESGSPDFKPGDTVFVPGASGYRDVKALFGGAASYVVSAPERILKVDGLEPDWTLVALAATAHHALVVGGAPDLILGHGVLGQLVARMVMAQGHPAPTVHEIDRARISPCDYPCLHPDDDERRDYRTVLDVSGGDNILDSAIQRLAPGGQVTLAGFYSAQVSFGFTPAFMREACIKIAAQWQPGDLLAVRELIGSGALSLDGLITHHAKASDAEAAYLLAFTHPDCLKMVLNWGSVQ